MFVGDDEQGIMRERAAMAGIDLRRRVEPGLVDLILMRGEFLPRADRALLEAYFRQGVSVEDLAALDGRAPRTIRRRIGVLSDRVLDEMFVYVMRSRERFGPVRGRVAEAVFLWGQSRPVAARCLGMSLYTVRCHCNAIEELARVGGRAA